MGQAIKFACFLQL